MIGWSLQHLGETRRAAEVGRETIELAMRASQPRAELQGRLLVAWVDVLLRGHDVEAQEHLDAGLELTRRLGSRRFEAQQGAVSAVAALRRGDRATALGLARQALDICREHGMGHIGPWVLGVCALVETDADARKEMLAAGEGQLAKGCVSHNHIGLRELAIEVALEMGDWPAVELNCERLRRYTAGEPLPACDFIIARGRALARFGQGERGTGLQEILDQLVATAKTAELNVALAAIEAALAEFPPRPRDAGPAR